jgi:hypothetical protein
MTSGEHIDAMFASPSWRGDVLQNVRATVVPLLVADAHLALEAALSGVLEVDGFRWTIGLSTDRAELEVRCALTQRPLTTDLMRAALEANLQSSHGFPLVFGLTQAAGELEVFACSPLELAEEAEARVGSRMVLEAGRAMRRVAGAGPDLSGELLSRAAGGAPPGVDLAWAQEMTSGLRPVLASSLERLALETGGDGVERTLDPRDGADSWRAVVDGVTVAIRLDASRACAQLYADMGRVKTEDEWRMFTKLLTSNHEGRQGLAVFGRHPASGRLVARSEVSLMLLQADEDALTLLARDLVAATRRVVPTEAVC